MNLAIPGLPSLVLYLIGAGLAITRIRAAGPVPARSALTACIGAAALLHAVLLGLLGASGDGALNLGFFHMLSAVLWLTVVMVMVGTLLRPMLNLGVVLFPLAALGIALQLTVGADQALWRALNWQLNVHAVLSVLAFAILTIAAAQAFLILLQDRALHRGAGMGLSQNLPPLERMEQLLFHVLGLGFGLLTLALISGALFVDDLTEQHLIHKTVLSVCAWVVFGLLLWGRWRFGWRGRTAVRLTLGGAGVLLLAYFGSKLVLELILQRVS